MYLSMLNFLDCFVVALLVQFVFISRSLFSHVLSSSLVK